MHFVITFGFSVGFEPNATVKINAHADKKKVKTRKGVDKRKRKETNENRFDATDSTKNIVNVDQVLAEIHVEYDLLPGYNFKFDCCCWNTAAKVYSESGDRCLKSIPSTIEENTFWVMFSVHHSVELNEAQLREFFTHTISYRMSFGRGKFSERAKKDKVTVFYIKDGSEFYQQDEFQEYDSADKPSGVIIPQPAIIPDPINGDVQLVTCLDAIPDSVHQYKFRKMLRKGCFPSQPLKSELCGASNETKEKRILQKLEKPVRKKQSEINARAKDRRREYKCELTLPAETVFSDTGTITLYDRPQGIPGVTSILIYVQCEDILPTKQLRMNLNPLSIKLEKLSNFPHDFLIQNGFLSLYAKIMFADRTIVTPCYSPNRIIRFEFIKSFLHDEFPVEELISFLNTGVFFVEIVGVRVANTSESLEFMSEKLEAAPSTKEEVLLAVALFDASELLRGSWEVKLRNNLSHPRSVYFNNNSFNDEILSSSWMNSPLSSDLLLSFDTSVKITVRVASDLRPLHQKVLQGADTLNRIFVILNDLNLATDILEEVSSHNCTLLHAQRSLDDAGNEKVNDNSKCLLTGFAIDSCDRFFIFLEGLSNGYLLNIWEKVMKLPVNSGRVYYNSDYVFLTRLYEAFIPAGGVVKLKLSESLEKQLQECGLYVGKNATSCRAKVLKRMGLMKLTSTMRSLCQGNLFPNSNTVMNLDNHTRKTFFGDHANFF